MNLKFVLKILPTRLLLAFCLISAIYAQKGSISFSAGYQEYNQATGFVILKDNASILGDDFQIEAENLQYNLRTGEIYAVSKVRLIRGEDIMRSDSLLYNAKTRQGRVEDFRAIMENTFVTGQSAILMPASMRMNHGFATTCSEEECHYKIVAREMLLIPDQALYLKGAAFYLGNTRVFSLPAYRFLLDKDKGMAAPLFLVPGYDSSRGVHAKVRSNFIVNENFYGTVELKPTARQGLEWFAEVEINQQKKAPARIRIDQQKDEFTRTDTQRVALEQAWYPTDNTDVQLRMDYLRDQFLIGADNEELNTFLEMRQRLAGGWTGRASYQVREDLDRNRFLLDNRIQSLDRKPSIELESPTRRVERTPYQYNFGVRWTDFTEQDFLGRVDSQDREVFANLFQDTLKFGKTRWDMNVQGRYNDYSNDGHRSYLRLNTGITHDFGSGFGYANRYNLNDVHGQSPFRGFDRLLDQEQITHRFYYNHGQFSSTLFQMAYDFKRHQYSNPSSAFQYRSVHNGFPWVAGLRLGYDAGPVASDLSDLKLANLAWNFNIRNGEEWSHELRGQYSWLNQQWESFTQVSDFLAHPKVYMRTENHYNALTSEFTRVKLGLIRDWDCLEGRLDWDFKQEELIVQVYLKQGSGSGLGLKLNYDTVLSVKPDLPGIEEPL
ncbi:MAG: LPS-assembly protein LptD [Candidatus Cloacimonetes bacterium]|nr:LPS-assembly protein LptD [Candidatus Cloacimonadota bacterium]